MENILAVIARLPFRPARTMPQLPHEYTIRGREGTVEDFGALQSAISRDGIVEYWNAKTLHAGAELERRDGPGTAKRYLYPGDGWRYWCINFTINRNRVEEADRLRKQGFISSSGREERVHASLLTTRVVPSGSPPPFPVVPTDWLKTSTAARRKYTGS